MNQGATMKVVQKITFLLALIIASLFFIYTLSFSTGWALGQWFVDFFREAQIVNKIIYQWGLWAVVITALNLVFNTHTNRRFFIPNYLFIALSIGILVGGGWKLITLIPPIKAMYLELNPELLNIVSTINFSTPGTGIFELGMIIAIVLFVQAGLILVVTIWKIATQLIRAKAKRTARKEATSWTNAR
jgi:hypothetical protein